MGSPRRTPVYLELGRHRVFACSVEWPGWCRSGRTEEAALETLADYARRYAAVAKRAGQRFPARAADRLAVVERVTGSATTDFGAPGAVPELDGEPLTAARARRLTSLVEAAWDVLSEMAASAPAELRKGPRGGGRNRAKMLQHVIGAEAAYARKIGVRHKEPELGSHAAVTALRADVADVLRAARTGERYGDTGWPPRYAARRFAWHVLDHAWEMQDRSVW